MEDITSSAGMCMSAYASIHMYLLAYMLFYQRRISSYVPHPEELVTITDSTTANTMQPVMTTALDHVSNIQADVVPPNQEAQEA